jgi:VWFA-related protein
MLSPCSRSSWSILTGVLLVAALFLTSYAQSGRKPEQPAARTDDAVHLRVEEVLVPIGVQSNTGKLPGRLLPSDIMVAEDKQRRQVTSVRRTPANILLVMDNSAEFPKFKRYELNHDAAFKVIDSLAEDDRAAIVTYGGEVQVLSGWTSDKVALRKSIDEKFKPRNTSHLYESLLYGAQELLPQASGRRSVVLLTDGYDSFTKNTLDKAREALDRARATVYVIAQNSMILSGVRPKAFNHDRISRLNIAMDSAYRAMIVRMQHYATVIEDERATLEELAEASGGAFWDPPTIDSFNDDAGFMVGEIESEYIIAYLSERPANDTGPHDLKVFPNHVGLKVRARRSIYSGLPAATDSTDHKDRTDTPHR